MLVAVFGTFDGLHAGHRAMLQEAKTHGDSLVALVALDETVERLKGRRPAHSFADRVAALQSFHLVDSVIAGDALEGEYVAVSAAKPDIVAFGYDQEGLRKDFEAFLKKSRQKISTVRLAPFEPKRYKSSILKGKIV